MDNRESKTPVPTESGRGYTIKELLSMMEPQYQAYRNTIRACITGLTDHAAQLAARGQEEQLPMFRRMITEMASFWGLAEQDTPKAYQEMMELYQDTFDRAVSAARESGCASELSEQTRADILTGLNLYAQEMESSGDLEQWIDECDMLAAQLRTEWGMETPQEDTPQNDVTKGCFPVIYRGSRSDAERLGETEQWWESFHNNVACARHIEAAIRSYFDDTTEQLKPGCVESVLAVWGASRVSMVLANTLQDVPSHLRHLYSGENLDWGGETQPLPDAAYRRYYVVDSGAGLVDSFSTQTRELCAAHFEKSEMSRKTAEDMEPDECMAPEIGPQGMGMTM